ncbi:MAG: tetratricopeptide repeat protein [Calditrichaceae bacterium]
MYYKEDKKLDKAPIIMMALLFVFVSQLSQGNNPGPSYAAKKYSAYQLAESLYTIGNFFGAVKNYEDSSARRLLARKPNTQFKLAYSYYKTGRYDSSAAMFGKLYQNEKFLEKYSRYFYIRSLWHNDPEAGIREAVRYTRDYKGYALADSLLIPISDAWFESGNFQKARDFYNQARSRSISFETSVYARIHAAYSLYYSGSKKQALDEFDQIIRRYPGVGETCLLVETLRNDEPAFFKDNFFHCVEVYFYNNQFNALRPMLEEYVQTERDQDNREKARYYLTKIYYVQERYSTALYGFNNLLNNLKNKNLEPYIRLYIARSHYKLGNRHSAINAYMDYAHRFPRRRIAPETVWKSAWIYEELQDLSNALATYRNLRKRWQNSDYTREAWFREGFTLYRLGHIKEADRVFTQIRLKNWPDVDVNRAQYWSSLCRELQGDTTTAKRLRLDLAKHLWDDYYTMKSYLLHKDYIDTNWQFINDFKNSGNAYSYYGEGMAHLLTYFDEAFLVRDLLGETYGFAALSDIKLSAQGWQDWMALAEIYKKFGAYNKAFRIYDYVDYKFFGDLNYTEKPFILKERFPFYFDDIIKKYARRYKLEQELIYALIKQESVYDPKASSGANAYGLMQLIPVTANDMARLARMRLNNNELLFDPDVNISSTAKPAIMYAR